MTPYQIRRRSKGKVVENVLISPPKIRKVSKNKRVLLDDSSPVSPKRQKTSSVSPSTIHSPSILDRLRNVDDCPQPSVIRVNFMWNPAKLPPMKIYQWRLKNWLDPNATFLFQVVLQYAKTILLLKVRHHNFKSILILHMSPLTFLPCNTR